MKKSTMNAFIASVIGSLFVVYFLQPIIEFIGKYLLRSTISFFIELVDSKYARASFLDGIDYAYYISMIIFIVLSITFIGMAEKIIDHAFSKRKNDNKPIKPIFQKFLAIGVIGYSSFFLLYFLVQISGEAIALNATSGFKRHMALMAPYLSTDEQKNLYSQWARMKSKNEYKNIYEELSKKAKEKNIVLDKRLLY